MEAEAVPDIAALQAYTGIATTVIVQDSLRGGIFNYSSSISLSDNGINFAATGIGSGTWTRQPLSNQIYAEWFGSADGASLQAAINYVENAPVNYGYILSAQSPVLTLDATININILNYEIDLLNTTLQPGLTFPDSGTLVKITGDYESEQVASLFCKMKIDALDLLRNITGIEITAKLLGNEHHYYIMNCNYGLSVKGACEKQNFYVSGGNCRELIRNEAGVGEGDVTPDENVFNVTGGKCNTYFHDLPLSGSSYQLNLNVENSYVGSYAVILEGSKLAKLSGEMRGNNGGGVYVNSSGLIVEFDGLHIHLTSGGLPINVQAAKQLIGNVTTATSQAGGNYIGNVIYGGILNLVSLNVTNGTALTVGNNALSQRCRSMIINFIGEIDDTSKALAIDNASNTFINATGLTKAIQITNYADNLSIELGAAFISSNYAITNTATTNKVSFLIKGQVTSTQLSAYSTPLAGMRVFKVSDKSACAAYYTGSVWVYEKGFAPLASPVFTTQVKSPKYTLSALNTAPASATDTGILGEIRVTSTYIYVCIATNSWVRSPLATW